MQVPLGQGDRTWLVALALLAVAAYLAVALTSPGYDDEFYNIRAIQNAPSLRALIVSIEHRDVHPPGQYLINALLFRITGSWSAVRATGALIMALVIFRFAEPWRIAGRKAMQAHFVLVVLHPSLLMWCTGLRWFSYLVPLFLVATLLVRRNPERGWHFWPVLAALGLGMLYLNYLALLLVPLLGGIAMWQRRARLRAEWPAIVVSGAVAALLAAPQLWFLVAYQSRNPSQRSGLAASLLGVVQGLPVHIGVFPLSVLGIVTLLAFVALIGLIVRKERLALLRDPEILLAIGGTLLILLTGLSGKGRNLTPLVPLVFAQFVPLAWGAQGRLGRALVLVLAASNLWGMANVLRHWDTGKGSWNMPVAQAVAATERAAAQCPVTPVIFAPDPVLAGNLATRAPLLVIGNAGRGRAAPPLPAGDYCLIELRTGHGAMPVAAYRRMLTMLPGAAALREQIGRDPYARLKRLADHDIPDHYVELYDHGRVAGPIAFEFGHRRSGIIPDAGGVP